MTTNSKNRRSRPLHIEYARAYSGAVFGAKGPHRIPLVAVAETNTQEDFAAFEAGLKEVLR